MTSEDAKTYLSKREIPRLFESLMTGLMYHRPSDHIQYLIDCLEKVKEKGQENITWSSFVDIRRTKTPLPPISNGFAKASSRPSSSSKTKEDKTSKDKASLSQTNTSKKVTLSDIPVVVVMGAPGLNKDSHVAHLLNNYPGWKHLHVGTLLQNEIQRHGDGQSKWKQTKDLISRGEPAPEDVTLDVLLEALKNASGAKGIIVTGFPRSIKQINEYEKIVTRVDAVFMIDCDEAKSMDRLLQKGRTSSRLDDSMSANTNRIRYFKAHTLPAAKHYDDQGKLIVIDGDAGTDAIRHAFKKSFDKLFFKTYGTHDVDSAPMNSPASIPEAAMYKKKYDKEDSFVEDIKPPLFIGPVPEPPSITEIDTGRKSDLPQCPIIFIAGSPGSGKGKQCQLLLQRYPDFVHLSMGDIIRNEISKKGTTDKKWSSISQLVSKGEMAPLDVTIDLLKQHLNEHRSAKGFLIEGFPRDKLQVEAFNKHIGGLNGVMLFDCDESYVRKELLKRGVDSGRMDDNDKAVANRLNFYKYNTLPLMKYYEDGGKLVLLDASSDIGEMFDNINQLLNLDSIGQKPNELRTAVQDREQAALNIQAIFHGYKTRSKEFEKLNVQPTTDHDKLEKVWDSEKAEAVTHIQAGFHGYKTRQNMKANMEYESLQQKLEDEEPVEEEVIEATIQPEGVSTTGNNIENPFYSKTLDDAADS